MFSPPRIAETVIVRCIATQRTTVALSMSKVSHSRTGKPDLSQAQQKKVDQDRTKISVLFALNQFGDVDSSSTWSNKVSSPGCLIPRP
jgi:hypothetical protein